MTTSPNLESPFWTFSLAVYGTPGVADECLALQEHLQLDVNLLLFAAYEGAAEGVRLDAADIAAAAGSVAVWHGEVVRALRQARQALKPSSQDADDVLRPHSAALRASVKAAELEAEKIEQTMLWTRSRGALAAHTRVNAHEALTHNLRMLMQFYGLSEGEADPAALMPRLCEAAMTTAGG